MIKLFAYINILRLWPHLLVADSICWKDANTYAQNLGIKGSKVYKMLYFLTYNKSFRSLFYYRQGRRKYLLQWLAKGENDFHLTQSCSIAPGVLFFHSYGTILNGWEIGEGSRITHNVTLGDKHGLRPRIGKRVEILPGAVIAGDVTIGDDCVIGPNCVVHKSVPANCVVIGNPAIILKENGVVVKRTL